MNLNMLKFKMTKALKIYHYEVKTIYSYQRSFHVDSPVNFCFFEGGSDVESLVSEDPLAGSGLGG